METSSYSRNSSECDVAAGFAGAMSPRGSHKIISREIGGIVTLENEDFLSKELSNLDVVAAALACGGEGDLNGGRNRCLEHFDAQMQQLEVVIRRELTKLADGFQEKLDQCLEVERLERQSAIGSLAGVVTSLGENVSALSIGESSEKAVPCGSWDHPIGCQKVALDDLSAKYDILQCMLATTDASLAALQNRFEAHQATVENLFSQQQNQEVQSESDLKGSLREIVKLMETFAAASAVQTQKAESHANESFTCFRRSQERLEFRIDNLEKRLAELGAFEEEGGSATSSYNGIKSEPAQDLQSARSTSIPFTSVMQEAFRRLLTKMSDDQAAELREDPSRPQSARVSRTSSHSPIARQSSIRGKMRLASAERSLLDSQTASHSEAFSRSNSPLRKVGQQLCQSPPRPLGMEAVRGGSTSCPGVRSPLETRLDQVSPNQFRRPVLCTGVPSLVQQGGSTSLAGYGASERPGAYTAVVLPRQSSCEMQPGGSVALAPGAHATVVLPRQSTCEVQQGASTSLTGRGFSDRPGSLSPPPPGFAQRNSVLQARALLETSNASRYTGVSYQAPASSRQQMPQILSARRDDLAFPSISSNITPSFMM